MDSLNLRRFSASPRLVVGRKLRPTQKLKLRKFHYLEMNGSCDLIFYIIAINENDIDRVSKFESHLRGDLMGWLSGVSEFAN